MKGAKKRIAVLVMALVFSLGGIAWAVNLGDIVGVVGGGFLVTQVAGPLNDFINKVTFNKGAKVEGHTKVVPIVSLGTGTRIGAAQEAGPRGEAIQKTKAVAQLEVTFRDRLRVKVLIPIDSENPIKQFKRVQGVGVSAIIDFRL